MTDHTPKRSCLEVEPLLTAYADGEVPSDQIGRVTAHLTACPPCRRRVEGERTVRDVLQARRDRLAPPAPSGLRQRCAACATTAGAVRGTRRLVRRAWLPLSFAATLLLAVGAVFVMGLNGGVEALATQLAMDHVKCFQFTPARDAVESGAAADEWYRNHGWLITVPRSEPAEGLELLDVRRCLSTQGIVAHMLYRWRGEPLSVYVLNGVPTSGGPGEHVLSTVGQDAIIWSDAGRTYAVVGHGPHNDLERVAHYVRASAR